jgi:hypothetical protein
VAGGRQLHISVSGDGDDDSDKYYSLGSWNLRAAGSFTTILSTPSFFFSFYTQVAGSENGLANLLPFRLVNKAAQPLLDDGGD